MKTSNDKTSSLSFVEYETPPVDTSIKDPLLVKTNNSNDSPTQDTNNNKLVWERNKSKFRWIILCLSAWAMFGSYYCYDNPTALQHKLQQKYNLSQVQYNLLYSVYSIPNVILPLFGGIFVDNLGAQNCVLLFTSLVTIGQLLFSTACTISSYPLMIVARVIYGLGGESLCVAVSTLLGVYFKGKEMALALGLNLALARLGSSLNDLISPRIYETVNYLPFSMWFGFCILLICLLFTLLLILIEKKMEKRKSQEGYTIEAITSGDRFEVSQILLFDVRYWLLVISCVVVYGCILPWNNIGTDFMESHYGFKEKKAESYLSIVFSISAALTPLFGFLIDNIGRRCEFLIISVCCLLITHYLMGFTQINVLLPLIIMGISYSIYASAIWPSIALVVNKDYLGTAYGLITSIQNGGLALIPLIVGLLTIKTDKIKNDSNIKNYKYVSILFCSLAFIGIITGLVLIIYDYIFNSGSLSKPSKQSQLDNIQNRIRRLTDKILMDSDDEMDDIINCLEDNIDRIDLTNVPINQSQNPIK